MGKVKKEIVQKATAPVSKCYKFNGTWSIGWVVYVKDSCIHLTEEQYVDFAQYVYECTGDKSASGKCKRC